MYIVIKICKYFYYFSLITLILVLPTILCGRGTFLFFTKTKQIQSKIKKRGFVIILFHIEAMISSFSFKGSLKIDFRPLFLTGRSLQM